MNQQVTLTFYSVLNHSDIGKAFCNFLKKQNKEETWKFVVASQLLEILVKKSNKKRAVTQMKQVLTYFEDKNVYLLPSPELQNLFTEILQKKQTSNNSDELYPFILELKNLLLPIYKSGEFQKFRLTQEAIKLCKNYEKNKLLVIPIIYEEQIFTDEDFERTLISPKDFDFFKKLESEDSKDWEEFYSTEKLKIYQSFQHYLHEVKFLEIPLVFRFNCVFNANIQETAAGIFYNFFENESRCVSFKIVDFQKNQFIVDQYMRGYYGHLRVRRLICTLQYENGSIFGFMKPLKFNGMDFLKFQDMKFMKGGQDYTERGCQDFYYVGFRITEIDDNETKFQSFIIVDGRYGKIGVPLQNVSSKAIDQSKIYVNSIKKMKGKNIKDLRDEFNEIKGGLPSQPFGKLLYDLNIDQYEKPKKNSNSKVSNILTNILDNIKSPVTTPETKIVKNDFLENISQKVQSNPNISQILDKIQLPVIEKPVEEKVLLDNSEGELFENITKFIGHQRKENEEISLLSELTFTYSDLRDDLTDMNEDCLTDIMNFESDLAFDIMTENVEENQFKFDNTE
jgi:hypothetical protein